VSSHRPRVFQRPTGVILVARAGVSDAGTQAGVGVIGCTAQAMTSDCPSPPSFRRRGSAAAGVAMPLMSDAETWWAPTIVGALIAVVGGLVAWVGSAAGRQQPSNPGIGASSRRAVDTPKG
jgi:hypothetical protein